MMSQHTPGPWMVGDTDWAPGYRIQAVVTSPTGDIAQIASVADARLIAQAPAMLEALREIEQGLTRDFCRKQQGRSYLAAKARAILRAVEGEK